MNTLVNGVLIIGGICAVLSVGIWGKYVGAFLIAAFLVWFFCAMLWPQKTRDLVRERIDCVKETFKPQSK